MYNVFTTCTRRLSIFVIDQSLLPQAAKLVDLGYLHRDATVQEPEDEEGWTKEKEQLRNCSDQHCERPKELMLNQLSLSTGSRFDRTLPKAKQRFRMA